MPFREKLKRTFTVGRRSGSTSPPKSTTNTSTETSTTLGGALEPSNTNSSLKKMTSRWRRSKEPKPRYPSDVYAPGEPMPKPKYRGPVNKQHQENLSAFSFASALEGLRRRSGVSQYSPMGSRLPSRLGSKSSTKAREISDNEVLGGATVEGGLIGGTQPLDPISSSRVSPGRTSVSRENLQGTTTITHGEVNGNEQARTFTEEELSKAMTQNTLKPATNGQSVGGGAEINYDHERQA